MFRPNDVGAVAGFEALGMTFVSCGCVVANDCGLTLLQAAVLKAEQNPFRKRIASVLNPRQNSSNSSSENWISVSSQRPFKAALKSVTRLLKVSTYWLTICRDSD